MELKELALIPILGAGHLAPMVELAKALTSRDHRISATIFVMEFPSRSKSSSNFQSGLTNYTIPRVRFVHLTPDELTTEQLLSNPPGDMMLKLAQVNKSRVKDFYTTNSTNPTAFIVDMFCTPFADVASELGAWTYVFLTTNACCLSFMLHLESLQEDNNQNMGESKESNGEVAIPGFANGVPVKVLPSIFFDKESGFADFIKDMTRISRKSKGIFVNTFAELETYAIKCLSGDRTLPPIKAVGPILNLNPESRKDENAVVQYGEIMSWLDNQPPTSVLFLCFGSMGTFPEEQVCEIACALEQSGHQFLWALRRRPPNGKWEPPSEYENFNGVLPEGFLDRTKDIGKVIGWAPQVAVLSHPSVGGFISHCGWNSIMESLWFGVPVATWPLYAEQQINAFEMVKEWGLAVEIKLDYEKEKLVNEKLVVTAKEIERGIRQLMEDSNESKEIRKKVKAMSEKSRSALVEGGSSYTALGHIIEEVLAAPNEKEN